MNECSNCGTEGACNSICENCGHKIEACQQIDCEFCVDLFNEENIDQGVDKNADVREISGECPLCEGPCQGDCELAEIEYELLEHEQEIKNGGLKNAK